MKTNARIFTISSTMVILFFCISCSVISRDIRENALPPIPFKELTENIQQYKGEMVILGGYILEVESKERETLLLVLQTPLSMGQSPSIKQKTEGRIIVVHHEYLDPEVYQKDKRITVAGQIIDTRKNESGKCIIPCLEIESSEIYLWPEYNKNHDLLFYDPFYSPYRIHPYYLHFQLLHHP